MQEKTKEMDGALTNNMEEYRTQKKAREKRLMAYAEEIQKNTLQMSSALIEELVAERVAQIRIAHPEKGDQPIPVDLVTGSGSGLDPHISVAAAEYQVTRLAQNNNMTEDEVQQIIEKCTDHRLLGIFGEETVNVLEVNLMLDGILE